MKNDFFRKFLVFCICLIRGIVFCNDPIYLNDDPRKSISQHEMVLNNRVLKYEAIVEEHILNNQAGTIITTSYIKQGIKADMLRPIFFIFNGGPGASSSPLHLSAFGPYILEFKNDHYEKLQNENTLLPHADLVFIDPAGTGFTLVNNEDSCQKYWDVQEDAISILQVIKTWLKHHGSQNSQLFLCGESYGTMRAAAMLGLDHDIPFAGAILLSSIFNFTILSEAKSNDLQYLLHLPSQAVAAKFHGRSYFKTEDANVVFDQAASFAENLFASALMKGNTISKTEQIIIAKKLSQYLGIDEKEVLEHNLRISNEEFMASLLKDTNQRLGKLDAIITGMVTNEKPPFNDPSFSKNPSNRYAVSEYYNKDLQFRDTSVYKTLNLQVNSKWSWSALNESFGTMSVMPLLEERIKRDQRIKLFMAGGLYDLATPVYGSVYSFHHSSIPRNRLEFKFYPTGHSIFEYRQELKKLVKDIVNFMGGC